MGKPRTGESSWKPFSKDKLLVRAIGVNDRATKNNGKPRPLPSEERVILGLWKEKVSGPEKGLSGVDVPGIGS